VYCAMPVFSALYPDLLSATPPPNVWLSVTFTGHYRRPAGDVVSDRCSCLAYCDDKGGWFYKAHKGRVLPRPLGDAIEVRLWRLAAFLEI